MRESNREKKKRKSKRAIERARYRYTESERERRGEWLFTREKGRGERDRLSWANKRLSHKLSVICVRHCPAYNHVLQMRQGKDFKVLSIASLYSLKVSSFRWALHSATA